jgi:anti-sigma factor RsiW
MACAFFEKSGAYLDRELAEGERVAYESHLSSCNECSRELKRLERLSQFLTAARMPEARPQQLLWKPRLVRQKVVRFAELLAAAAAFVMALSGFWLLRMGARSDSASVENWEQMAVTQQSDSGPEADEDERLVQAMLRGRP